MYKKYTYYIVIFLIVASFISFGRIIGNDFITFDDDEYIAENNYIKSGINTESIKWALTSSHASNWHPLTWISHMLDWQLFGANAAGHHLVNLLLHIGSAILLFLFFNKTTGSVWISAFVAALFALHPLRVESVAWAAERKDVLSMFFGIATLYVYALYVEDHKLSKYFLCLALFALGLLAKPMLVTMPFVLLLIDYWPLGRWQKVLQPELLTFNNEIELVKKRFKQSKANSIKEQKISMPLRNRAKVIRSLLWEKVPFVFLAVISSIVTIWAQSNGGLIASLEQLPLLNRMLNAIVSYVVYVIKIFWPVNLAVFYPYEQFFPLWQVFGAASIILAISIAVIYFIKKAPFLFVGWFWYLGALVPVIGLMQVGLQSMADRYTYFPSIGIAIILAYGIAYLLPEGKLYKIIIMAAAIILAALTFLTWQQCGYWKNSVVLYDHVLKVTKNNYLAHSNLGIVLAAQGRKEEAITQYLAAIKINPNYADAYYNLANLLIKQGKIEDAIDNYRQAVKINPDHFEAHCNLADAFLKQHKIDKAIEHFREAARITPPSFAAFNNLGVNLERQLKHDEAIYYYRKALLIEPNNPGIHFNLGVAFGNKGELREAAEHFRQAIILKPYYDEAKQALKLAQKLEK